jgi:hypothetical protein
MDRPRQPAARPLIRRDAEGAERTASSWESLSERLIREAQEAGAFDQLPGHGRPLVLEDHTFAGELALAHHLLRNAGLAPPWIEADKEVRDLDRRVASLLARAERAPVSSRDRLARELAELADAHDAAVERLASLAPSSRLHRSRLDRVGLRRRLMGAPEVREGPDSS